MVCLSFEFTGEVYHLSKTTGSYNVAGVDEAVQVAGRLLDGLAHVIVAVEVEDVVDEV